jgi:hypothetical protein
MSKLEAVNHPAHYGGADSPYEVIKVIEAFGWHRCTYLSQMLKYAARAGKKDASKELEDLEKAAWWLNRKIERMKAGAK